MTSNTEPKNKLRGSVKQYEKPMESVGEEDWDALKAFQDNPDLPKEFVSECIEALKQRDRGEVTEYIMGKCVPKQEVIDKS